MLTFAKMMARFVHLCVTRYRLLNIRDWAASLFCMSIMFAAPIICLFFVGGSTLFSNNAQLLGWIGLAYLGVVSVPVLYVLRLRAIGITDADFHIQRGINYSEALKSATHGFDFQGIGASKLRDEENDLREALKSAHATRNKVRFLLLDPKSHGAIESMEQSDGTQGYKEKVEGSISFIRKVSASFENVAELCLYPAASVKDVEPFRLFITDEACLVSPFVTSTGVHDQGRYLPQIRISKYGFPRRSSPTIYRAFKDAFEKSWHSAKRSESL